MKIKVICFFVGLVFSSLGQNDRIQLELKYNGWQSTNSNYSILSFQQNNIRFGTHYKLGGNKSVGIFASVNSQIRAKTYKEEKKLLKENFYFFEIIPTFSYSLFGFKRHEINHNLGFSLINIMPNDKLSIPDQPGLFPSIIFMRFNQYEFAPTLNKIHGFLETGYDFYVYKGLHLSVTGRATLLSYNLNYDSSGNPTDEKRFGLNYMLFYGLGYTFGREE